MKKDVRNIGSLKYIWTILTGKNRQIKLLTEKGEKIQGQFVITMGKNAVIITDIQDGKRIPVLVRPWKKIEETTALGAVYAAGLAVDFWRNVDELREKWAIDRIFKPQMDEKQRKKMIYYWNKAIEKAKGWIES